MKPGAATKQAKITIGVTRSEPQPGEAQKTKTGQHETSDDLAADFLIGALLYSLFASGNVNEMLPDGDGD